MSYITHDGEKKIFRIETSDTLYCMQVVKDRYLSHLYYGKKEGAEYEEHKHAIYSFAPYYNDGPLWYNYFSDTAQREFSGFDDGDFRTCGIKIRNGNGDSATVLEYTGYEIFKGRRKICGMPCADADGDTETLAIIMKDSVTLCTVKCYYTVFPKENVISRYVAVENGGENGVTVEKCMSLFLDLPCHDYDMISLYGSHMKERQVQRVPLHYGAQNIFSRRGASSHQFNPFIALCDKCADFENGSVYGFNFVWSGSFSDEVEVCQTGSTRVCIGLGEENFSYYLGAGKEFISPEAVMTYSAEGIGKMSRNFHKFINKRILPSEPFECRPVVINTWEACYFNINEDKLLDFATSAKRAGIDMVVMDDGWFGNRTDDHSSLGDWYPDKNKFPDGLKSFVGKMKEGGLKFGIWIEPEMVNPDSELYRAHPEWCIRCKGREPMLSRWQLVLDMGNPDVIEYLKERLSKTFDGVGIDYFKWDMNRHLSQVASSALPPDRQKEASFRFMLGVYEFYDWFTKHFKGAMIENCSGGGGRYDLGMMKYSTMIWTSDNTDPVERIRIQYGSLLGYPASTMSCHVSNGEACENADELKFRGDVAMNGALGYEMLITEGSDKLLDGIKAQISNYRKYEDLIFRGEYYPLSSPFEVGYFAHYYISEDKRRILLSCLNCDDTERDITLKVSAVTDGKYIDAEGREYTCEELRHGIKIQLSEKKRSEVLYLNLQVNESRTI